MRFEKLSKHKISGSILTGGFSATDLEIAKSIPQFYYDYYDWECRTEGEFTLATTIFEEELLIYQMEQLGGKATLQISEQLLEKFKWQNESKGHKGKPCIALTIVDKNSLSGEFFILSLEELKNNIPRILILTDVLTREFKQVKMEEICSMKKVVIDREMFEIFNGGKSQKL